MATWDYGPGSRTSLPSISQFDADRSKPDASRNDRQKPMSSLSLSAIVTANPSVSQSGPPPPYSATSNPDPMPGRPGYISPPESMTRRSTREDDGPIGVPQSLPSIHEALGGRALIHSNPAPAISPTNYHPTANSIPTTAVKALLADTHPATSTQPQRRSPPRDFSHPTPYAPTSSHPATPARSSFSTADKTATLSKEFEPRPIHATTYGYPPSPRTNNTYPPYQSSTAVQSAAKSSYHPSAVVHPPAQPIGVDRVENGKIDDARHSFSRPGQVPPYGETVKRQLEEYDIDVAIHEIREASARTLDFSSYWSQKCYQTNRSHATKQTAPSLNEIDEMMRHSQHIMENLSRIRDLVVLQQTPPSEDRTRIPVGPDHAHYRSVMDDYKSGGYTAVDAKKRRGKAAPPGRCHSCARAETPEWRRGPDGARTLCNACGLHYAKLTRKLGTNQNVSGSTSNLPAKSA